MGKETISSQELADYTHVNSTQIRRDLSGFGKFGKRGVGYNVDSLVSQIRKILRTAGQHNIALFGAGHLGQAIASSDIFADHGFRVVAIFDTDQSKIGKPIGPAGKTGRLSVRSYADLDRVVEEEDIVVGVLAVPTEAAQKVADDLVEAGVKIIFNYSESLLQVPPGRDGPHVQPGGRPALRALLLLDLIAVDTASRQRGLRGFRGLHRWDRGGVRDPRPGDVFARPALRGAARLRGRAAQRVDRRRADLVGDRDPLWPRREPGRGARPAARLPDQAVPARGRAGRAAGGHRHTSVEPLAGAAHHRHRALPPRGGGPEVRRVAQQHLQRARARGSPGRRSGGGRVRSAAAGAAGAPGDLRQLAVP